MMPEIIEEEETDNT